MAFPFFKRGRASAAVPAVERPEAAPAGDLEARSRIGDTIRQSDTGFAQFFGFDGGVTGEVVTIETALKVPAVWAAVNFLARSLASLPMKSFERKDGVREVVADDPLMWLLNDAANDETTSYDLRRAFWTDVFTAGRAILFIERDRRGQVINLWPLEIGRVTVRRQLGRTIYLYDDNGRAVTYAAADVLDVKFMPGASPLTARSPIYYHQDTIGLALAITRYGAKFFNNGGVPPFVITGPIRTGAGLERAAQDMGRAVQDMTAAGRNAIVLPDGHTLTTLGVDPEKMQMIDGQRFVIEQVARIFGMPPAFLQDLTHGTFSNVEQQDLQLVKHLIAPWAKAFEKEAKLKLYGRAERARYPEANLDGLARGDLKTRSEAFARQIATGQITPNEARRLENRPDMAGGDVLLVQGALVPATDAGRVKPTGAPATLEGQTDE